MEAGVVPMRTGEALLGRVGVRRLGCGREVIRRCHREARGRVSVR